MHCIPTINMDWNSVRRQLREQNKLKQLSSAASMRWSECQLYIDVNKPVYELLRVVDSALPVIGKIQHFEIQEKIKNLPGITSAQRHELYQSVVNKWTLLHIDLHSAGFLLDSEYVSMAQNTNEEVMNGFYRLVEKLYPDTEDQFTIATQLTQFRSGHMVSSEDQSPRQQPRQCQPINGGKILELVFLSFKSLLCEFLVKQQARVKQNGIGACLFHTE